MSRYRELAPLASGLLMAQRAKDAGDEAAYQREITQFKTEMEGLKGVMGLQISRQQLDIAGAQEAFRQQQRPGELLQQQALLEATQAGTTGVEARTGITEFTLQQQKEQAEKLSRFEEAFKEVSGKTLEQHEAEKTQATGRQVIAEAGLGAEKAEALTDVGAAQREAEAVISGFGLQIAKDELEQTKVTALTEAGYGAIEADILVKILKKQPGKMDAEIELLLAQAGKARGELVVDAAMRRQAEDMGIDYDAWLFRGEQAKRGIPHAQQISITEKALADLRSGTVTLAQVMARAYDAGLDTGVNPTDKDKAIKQLEQHLKRQKQLFNLATGIVWDSLGVTFREGSMAQLREVGGGIQDQPTPQPATATPLDDPKRKQNAEQLRRIRQGL